MAEEKSGNKVTLFKERFERLGNYTPLAMFSFLIAGGLVLIAINLDYLAFGLILSWASLFLFYKFEVREVD